MNVFKSFFKIASKNKTLIIVYTVLLVLFGGLQTKTNDVAVFEASKPDVTIIDEDNTVLSKNLVDYFDNYSNIKEVKDIDDALFNRDVNYVIYIYKDYEKDVLNNTFKELEIKSTGDYQASLASMLLSDYLNVQNKYTYLNNKEEINNKVNNILSKNTNVEMASKLNTTAWYRVSNYYNFASYSILASVVLVISMILSSYNDSNIRKRILISNTSINKINFELMKSASIYTLILCIFFNVLGFIIIGKQLMCLRGLFYVINSFIYSIAALMIAFIVSNLVSSKNAINGIVNVIAIGSSFLCGVFVPPEMLGKGVLLVGHIFPTFYYVDANILLTEIETLNITSLKPLFNNYIILGIFIIGFLIINTIINNVKKRNN